MIWLVKHLQLRSLYCTTFLGCRGCSPLLVRCQDPDGRGLPQQRGSSVATPWVIAGPQLQWPLEESHRRSSLRLERIGRDCGGSRNHRHSERLKVVAQVGALATDTSGVSPLHIRT